MNLFVALLMMAIGAGLVAAGGDWVGHRAARRKIRIAGMRPRHASTLIAVVTGVVIALVTYGIVLAVWKDAREALTSYTKVKADLASTTQELSRKEGQLEEAEQRVSDADQRVVDAEERVTEAEDEAAELNGQLSAIRGQIIELTIELDTKNQEFEKLEKQVRNADKLLREKQAEAESEQFRVNGLISLKDKLGGEIEELEQQIAQMLEGEIVMRRGTYLAYQRVNADELGSLAEIVQGALNRVNVSLTRDGLTVDESSAGVAQEFISTYPQQGDSLIIVSAGQNVIEGRDVLLSFESRPLKPLVSAGDTVLEVEVGISQATISALGGGSTRIAVPATFSTDSLVEFSVRLQARLIDEAKLVGFLPNLRTGEITSPVPGLTGRVDELMQTPRPFTIRIIANTPMSAIDGLADCRIEITGAAVQ